MSTKKNFWIGLPMQMMYGLVLGVIVGTMVSSEFGATYLQPLGQLFIRLIRMVVVPLVVATLIAGSAGLGDASKIGKIAVKTILFFAITTAIAVTIGLIVANFMEPGTGLTISVEGLKAKAAAAPPLSKVLLEIVPINPIEAFAKGNMLQVIFFSIFFGFCLSLMGDSVRMVTDFFQKVGDVMIKKFASQPTGIASQTKAMPKRGAQIRATDRRIARFTMFATRNGRIIPRPRRTPSVAILIPMKMKK